MSTKKYSPIRTDDEDNVCVYLVITAPDLSDPLEQIVLIQSTLLSLKPYEIFDLPQLATLLKRMALLLSFCNETPIPAVLLPITIREVLKQAGAKVEDVDHVEKPSSPHETNTEPSDN